MSFSAEVKADNSGTWAGNALRFATREEAEHYVRNLSMRWTSVYDTRVVEAVEPVNYKLNEHGRAVPIEQNNGAAA